MIVDATGTHEKILVEFMEGGLRSVLDVGCGAGEKTARIARLSGTSV